MAEPNSPEMDPKMSNLRRRSSMGHSVRKSRSIIGLPFEDLIAAIPKNSSTEEKILKIVSTSWTTNCQIIQHEYDEAEEDNSQADLADFVRNQLSQKPLIKHETLLKVKEKIGEMTLECKKQKPQKIIPPRLKKLQNYLDCANKEAEEWKSLHHSRKNKVKRN